MAQTAIMAPVGPFIHQSVFYTFCSGLKNGHLFVFSIPFLFYYKKKKTFFFLCVRLRVTEVMSFMLYAPHVSFRDGVCVCVWWNLATFRQQFYIVLHAKALSILFTIVQT